MEAIGAKIQVTDGSSSFLLTPYRALPFYQGNSSSYYGYSPAFLDLNHDGIDDGVFSQEYPYHFIAMNVSGEIYWTVPITDFNTGAYSGDFDCDGYIDDVLILNLNTYPGSELKAMNELGQLITHSENGTVTYSISILNLYIGDFDSNGYLDDFCFTFTNASGPYLGAMNYLARKLIWSFKLELGEYFPTARIPCDLTNSGHLNNYFVSFSNKAYALGSNGVPLWTFPGGGDRLNLGEPASVGDMDHDGFKDDIVFISPINNSIYALTNNGAILWNYSSSKATGVHIYDYDGDGFCDEIFMLEGKSASILDESGELIWKTSTDFNLGGFIIADMSGDGLSDFLISPKLMLNHSEEILWINPIWEMNGLPIMTCDILDNGFLESIWLVELGDMVVLRVGAPNITVTIQEGPHLIMTVGLEHNIHAIFTSHEPYLTQTIEIGYNGSFGEQNFLPNQTRSANIPLNIDSAGEFTYEVSLRYCGVIFVTATIHITVNFDTYFIILGAVGGVVGALVIGERVVRHRRQARGLELAKKKAGEEGNPEIPLP